LSEQQQADRLEWAEANRTNKWVHHVDIDEKWFYVYSHSGKLKLPPGIEKPKQKLKSKRFIGKVMMLCAVARPDPSNNFDGLVGCWRVCEQQVAKRGDKRTGLKKGDRRTVDVTMDADKFEAMLRADVIPAIRAQLSRARVVTLQMDNASPHKSKARPGAKTMMERLAAVLRAPRSGGPKIGFFRQVANSPDTNACDLGFFKSMDSRLPKRRDFNLDKFADQCYAAFHEYPSGKLGNLFDTKTRVCECIVADKGNNEFEMPHRAAAERAAAAPA
jgi:hypothetical protein